MKIINLTPHAINFVGEDGSELFEIVPSGVVARVTTETVTIGNINGIPVKKTMFGEVDDLLAPMPNTVYIVSSLVAQRCKDRDDVFIPNETVRDEKGRIIGCKSLGKI